MMRLSSMLGLPVVRNGRLLARVERAVLTRDGRFLRGLVVRHGLGMARWIGAEDVRILGEVSVIVDKSPGKLPKDADYALGMVQDTGGMLLGYVTDVMLHPASREVTALEVDLGPSESLLTGRLLACDFAVSAAEDEGLVMLGCGCSLEKPRGRGGEEA